MATVGSIVLTSGGFQDAIVNQYFGQVIRVTVRDTTGAAMVNEPVVFGLPVSGAGGVFAWSGTRVCYSSTDRSGIAVSEQIIANDIVGQWLGLCQPSNALSLNVGYYEYNLPVTPIAYTMSLDSGSNQSRAQNTAFAPLVVLVKDQYGNPLPGSSIAFTFPGANGSPGGVINVNTDANGYATSPVFTSNTATGSFTVTAAASGYPKANPTVSTTWTTVDATIPTSFSIVSGNNQQAPPSSDFGKALVVSISNGLGQPMSGLTVTFTAPTTGARCTFAGSNVATAVTDANGKATSSIPKANATLGKYNVPATASGLPTLTFKLTNGLNYFPEVCTVLAAPSTGVNQPGTDVLWSSGNNAVNGNTTGATIVLAGDQASRTLFCSPMPDAPFPGVDDLADITKFVATFDYQGNRGSGSTYWPDVVPYLQDGTVRRSTGPTKGSSDTYASTTVTFAKPYSNPSGAMTGATLKAGNWGIGFVSTAAANKYGTLRIRLVKLQVCYQNPDLPVAVVDVPLHFCEA